MNRVTKTAILLALVLVGGSALIAQEWKGRGRLQGMVKDEQGNPIVGAKLTFRMGTDRVDPTKPGPEPVISDKTGKWAVLGLGQGTWSILIEAQGYNSSEGQSPVNEFAAAAPLSIVLKKPSAESVKAAEAQTKAGQANAAISQADALVKEEKFADARTQYQKAIELSDLQYHAPFIRAIARTYFMESQSAKTKEEKNAKLGQAIDALKQADQLKPDDPETLQVMVDLLVDAGREAEAQTYMAKLPAGTKVAPDTMINIGIRAFNEKHLDQALKQFTKVIEENPAMADAYYYRGLCYLNMNKTPEAKADFKKLIEIDPNHKYAKEAKDYLSAL
jgi:tetratricopeptide (TPR) repeat protein